MTDDMSSSDIAKEMHFWQEYIQPENDFKHKSFYTNFFDFSLIKGDVLEIGCGGSPFTTYTKDNEYLINLTLLDPLLSKISEIPRYNFLKQYAFYDNNFLTSDIKDKYDFIICLNVLDHFSSCHVDFITKMKSILKPGGQIYLYYDIRKMYSDGHYPIDHSTLYNFITTNFIVLKDSLEVNPVHHNWSTVFQSYRAILSQ